MTKLAIDDKDWPVRIAAVEKLTDKTLLSEVAQKTKDMDVRKIAETKAKQTPVK